jgi:hypothetical protein
VILAVVVAVVDLILASYKGIPFDNSRMMDELLQFHIITPNQKGKAIWDCKLSGGGFKKPVKLTMLKMPLEKIYFKAGGNNDYDDDYDDVFPGDIIEQTACFKPWWQWERQGAGAG